MKTLMKQTGINFNEHFNTDYEQLDVSYQSDSQSLWFYMHASPRPCFSPKLLSEMQDLFGQISAFPGKNHPVQYLIAASNVPGVYNLGGDLSKFKQFIADGDKEKLRAYAYQCLDMGFECSRHFNHGITTISLIQGSALGGGFEAALSCNVIVAEKSVQMGFPEILFNLFPGMGAYSYLSRRVHPSIAEKMISSGRMYTGEELHEMGIVDVLAEDGEGEAAVTEYIKRHSSQRTSRLAMQQAYMHVNPVSLAEMRAISDIWVDTAIELDERSLRIMERLVRAQGKKMDKQVSDSETQVA
ncbi:Enoyl-CoA hydratase [hydrothermal vent metagenome]|uniref:Enoyl-CoA hydratase n=1 Tax=hydrothermal vent metagenome TaxID=652676 RepID=A0A3B0ZR96_9ZZZZ